MDDDTYTCTIQMNVHFRRMTIMMCSEKKSTKKDKTKKHFHKSPRMKMKMAMYQMTNVQLEA